MTDPISRLNAALEGRYQVERQVGEGGMATVYLADDLRHERKVALKVLKPELAAVVGAERFLAEIKTTAKLQHPHVLPLHDSGEADGFLFYVMPYVEGESLRQRLDREKQLAVDEAVRIATNVAEALDYAHRQGVIHRDIKPANILLQDGKPVVSDFGIALAVGMAGGGRLTETGLSLGTPHYMSPEQATGDQTVGVATDIYALACVLYEMLVGEPPYTGSTAQAILGKIIQAKPVSASETRHSVPPNVDAAIRKALEKLSADRFSGAQDFANALADKGFRHGEEAAGLAGSARGLWNPLSLAATAVAVLATVALGAALLEPNEPPPVMRQVLSSEGWIEGSAPIGRRTALAPDGSSMVLPIGNQLGLKLRGSIEIEPIPDTEGAWDPVYSPDGAWIAYAQGTELYKRPVVGGSPIRLAEDTQGSAGAVAGIAWLDDGMILYEQLAAEADARARRITRIDADGGSPEVVFWPEEEPVAPTWVHGLPGARAALVVACPGGTCPASATRLYAVDLEDGSWRIVLEDVLRAWYAPSGHLVYVRPDGAVFAQPLDATALELAGSPVPLFQGVRATAGTVSDYADIVIGADGTLVYVGSESTAGAIGANGPVWVRPDGSEERLSATIPAGNFSSPALSPDGRKIAFEYIPPEGGAENIWLYDVQQETFQRLTFGESRNLHPFWSPDGSEVGFSSDRDGFFALYSRPWDLSADTRLVRADPDDGLYEGAWTPDGSGLVYRKGSNTTTNVIDIGYVSAHPDSTPRLLVATPATEDGPALSPDGRWLAYRSNESGTNQVYVRPFPGPGGQAQVSTDGGINPVWDPSGDRIFYLGPPGSGLMVATIRAEPSFAVESRELLHAWPYRAGTTNVEWDVSADGSRVLAVPVVAQMQEEGQLVLVTNFFEELRALGSN